MSISRIRVRDTGAVDWSARRTVVTDEAGDPLIVYHGTSSAFSAFDPSQAGRNHSDNAGIFFQSTRDGADLWGKIRTPDGTAIAGGHVVCANIYLENPLIIDAGKDDPAECWYEMSGRAKDAMEDGGYDGAIVLGENHADGSQNRLYVVRDPSAIRVIDVEIDFSYLRSLAERRVMAIEAGRPEDRELARILTDHIDEAVLFAGRTMRAKDLLDIQNPTFAEKMGILMNDPHLFIVSEGAGEEADHMAYRGNVFWGEGGLSAPRMFVGQGRDFDDLMVRLRKDFPNYPIYRRFISMTHGDDGVHLVAGNPDPFIPSFLLEAGARLHVENPVNSMPENAAEENEAPAI